MARTFVSERLHNVHFSAEVAFDGQLRGRVRAERHLPAVTTEAPLLGGVKSCNGLPRPRTRRSQRPTRENAAALAV